MNYRNLSMDELTTTLANEPNRDCFIEAAKELTERIVNSNFHSQSELDDAVIEARDEGIEEGRKEMRDECRVEMVEYVENTVSQKVSDALYDNLLNHARVLG